MLMGGLIWGGGYALFLAESSTVIYYAVNPTVVEAATSTVASHDKRAEALRAYLVQSGAKELSTYSEAILALPRWEDAIAISAKETSYCTKGVGNSKNNCGAIRRASGPFRIYENKFDGIEAVSALLERRYAGQSFAEMNGVYCVHEEAGGGKCPGWTETIESVKRALVTFMENYESEIETTQKIQKLPPDL